MAKTRIPAFGTRPIKTRYYRGKHTPVKETSARWANKAVPNAIAHMQVNEYDATSCEVWDDDTGELHAVIKRSIKGNIEIVFHRRPVRN